MGYKYYDSPEGEDCFLKMWYMSKNAAVVGVTVAITDIMAFSKPTGYVQTAGRFIYFTAPITMMAASFAATACMANSIRGKDDPINYAIGGAVSGSIFGTWMKSVRGGGFATVLLATAAYWKKKSIEEGWKFIKVPAVTRPEPLVNTQIYDFSQLKGK